MTNTTKPTLQQRLQKAKVQLLLDFPFFGCLATKLENTEAPVGTACTNGKRIMWDPDFIASLSDAELKGVYAHEVMHPAMGHLWRLGDKDHKKWNRACDLAINPLLKEAGLTLPKCAIFPKNEGRAAEYYYAHPEEEIKQQGGGSGQGQSGNDPGGCGAFEEPEGEQEGQKATPEEIKAMEADWKINVTQAATIAKNQGKLPAGLSRFVDELVNPKVPWGVILRDFVERSARNDYNWTVPNRRHLQRGIVLPTLISDELPEIVIAIDTSGSIGGQELQQFASEVSAVLAAYDTTIKVLWADAAVAGVQTFTRADLPLKFEPKGGGGTDFRPVFRWVEKSGETPACLIYLTDMCGTFPDEAPAYPVLWAVTTNRKAPWGETVRMEG